MREFNWENKLQIGAPDVRMRPPTLAEVSPEYRAAIEKRAALTAEMDQLDNEKRQLALKIDGDGGFTGEAGASVSSLNARQARTASILGENPSAKENARARYVEIGQRIGDLKSAIEILDNRLIDLRMAASNLVCQRIEADHKRLVADICARMVELHAAADAYYKFADALNADNVAWSRLHAMQPLFLGRPNDRYGKIGSYLREAVTHGFWWPIQIPEKIR